MKRVLTAILLMLNFSVDAGAQFFQIGQYDSLQSVILNEERRILVHVPNGARDSNRRYPVMYLLDGEHHFTKTIGIIDHLSNTAGNELCPEMIVVAIVSDNRERDFVPAKGTGKENADKFPLFLEKELIPFIDGHYPTAPYRVFVGHSLGGLRVINTLIYQSRLFDSYIALDPSLGHVRNWINDANEDFTRINYTNKSLYVAMGHTMPKGMDTAVICTDTSGAARHMRSIMFFAKNAETHSNGLDFKWKYYPDETHQSVVFKGTYDGLIADFSWFKNEKLFDIFRPEVNAEAAVKIMTEYYDYLSSKMGYKQLPPEQETSELIEYLIYKKWHEKALAFAELNGKNYPNSEVAKSQLQAARWSTKKSIALLFPKLTTKQIYQFVKKEVLKNEPEYNISEAAINSFGYELMQQDKLSDAELLFKLNAELYPDSYNVYDSYGECLLKSGKEEEGIAAYKMSLKLNPENTNAKHILAKYPNSK